MKKPEKWEVSGSCSQCGNPVFMRGLSCDAPEVRRSCACVPVLRAPPQPVPITVPTYGTQPYYGGSLGQWPYGTIVVGGQGGGNGGMGGAGGNGSVGGAGGTTGTALHNPLVPYTFTARS